MCFTMNWIEWKWNKKWGKKNDTQPALKRTNGAENKGGKKELYVV